jgi:hypothetical protein
VVVRGWKAWKKRMNLRYWGIFWRERPIGEIEMNLVKLKRREKDDGKNMSEGDESGASIEGSLLSNRHGDDKEKGQ